VGVAGDLEGRRRLNRGGVAGVLVQQNQRGRTEQQKGEGGRAAFRAGGEEGGGSAVAGGRRRRQWG